MGGAAAEVDRSVQRKTKTKTVCLLRGNGHRHAMVLTGKDGAVDLEKMATAMYGEVGGSKRNGRLVPYIAAA